MKGSVVAMLNVQNLIIPQLRMLVAVTSKQMNHNRLYHLYMSIFLWMESSTPLHLGVHHSPQDCEESKVEPYMLKEGMINFINNNLLVTWTQIHMNLSTS